MIEMHSELVNSYEHSQLLSKEATSSPSFRLTPSGIVVRGELAKVGCCVGTQHMHPKFPGGAFFCAFSFSSRPTIQSNELFNSGKSQGRSCVLRLIRAFSREDQISYKVLQVPRDFFV